MFDLAAATGRWARVRAMMSQLDIDLLLAVDQSRDEILLGCQRWLTGFISVGGPAAALIGRDGSIELITDRIGKPVTEYYRAHRFPIELVSGFSADRMVERIARYAPKRVGIAETQTLNWTLAEAIGAAGAEIVDVSNAMLSLRLRKSADEIAAIRKSCAIADDVWQHVGEIFKVGRRNYEIVADIDHLVGLRGSERGFHLILKLPFLGRPMRSTANPELVEANARYLVEISPRYEGYYSQLTLPVSTFPADDAALSAYDDVVAAKEAAQPRMRPGVELGEVGRFIADFLAKRGRTMTSLSLGHFCGMALEEPRHDPASAIVLEEGMTLIFHPVLADAHLHSMMRADTYLITASGAERLTRFAGGLLMAS